MPFTHFDFIYRFPFVGLTQFPTHDVVGDDWDDRYECLACMRTNLTYEDKYGYCEHWNDGVENYVWYDYTMMANMHANLHAELYAVWRDKLNSLISDYIMQDVSTSIAHMCY